MKIGRSRKRNAWLFITVGVLLIGATPERTVYSNTSNQELKARVMRLVDNIRQLAYAYRQQDENLLTVFNKRESVEDSKNEKQKVRATWIKESDATHDAFMRQYKARYWADAILLRSELLRRLPKRLRQPQLTGIYQYPTNLLGVEAIADNLELLAKSLPDK